MPHWVNIVLVTKTLEGNTTFTFHVHQSISWAQSASWGPPKSLTGKEAIWHNIRYRHGIKLLPPFGESQPSLIISNYTAAAAVIDVLNILRRGAQKNAALRISCSAKQAAPSLPPSQLLHSSVDRSQGRQRRPWE